MLNCCPAREREGKLLFLYSLLPHTSPLKQPHGNCLQTATQKKCIAPLQLTATYEAVPYENSQRSPKISQLLFYSYFIHSSIHTPGAFASLTLHDSDTQEVNSYLLLPIVTGREHQVQMPCCTQRAVTTAFPTSCVEIIGLDVGFL